MYTYDTRMEHSFFLAQDYKNDLSDKGTEWYRSKLDPSVSPLESRVLVLINRPQTFDLNIFKLAKE